MKDIQGRDIVVGSGVLYAVSGRLVTGVVTDVEDDKMTVQKDDGGTSTVTVTEDKVYLLG